MKKFAQISPLRIFVMLYLATQTLALAIYAGGRIQVINVKNLLNCRDPQNATSASIGKEGSLKNCNMQSPTYSGHKYTWYKIKWDQITRYGSAVCNSSFPQGKTVMVYWNTFTL
jgi:hypothetical protein